MAQNGMAIALDGPMRFVPLMALLALGACGEPEVAQRLRQCELLSDGYIRELGIYAPTECYRDCFGEAECDELEAALCRTDVSLLVECDRRCAFECASGALIAVESVCNGFEDCADGEDEFNCPVYVCEDGSELIGEGHRCDGWRRCPDGSDELDCPDACERFGGEACQPFACTNGETAPSDARCNGWPQCSDESDEEGCAELTLMCES